MFFVKSWILFFCFYTWFLICSTVEVKTKKQQRGAVADGNQQGAACTKRSSRFIHTECGHCRQQVQRHMNVTYMIFIYLCEHVNDLPAQQIKIAAEKKKAQNEDRLLSDFDTRAKFRAKSKSLSPQFVIVEIKAGCWKWLSANTKPEFQHSIIYRKHICLFHLKITFVQV